MFFWDFEGCNIFKMYFFYKNILKIEKKCNINNSYMFVISLLVCFWGLDILFYWCMFFYGLL